MITASGRHVWPWGHAPKEEWEGGWPSDSDIGQALGRIPRFAGGTVLDYPVLAHLRAGGRMAADHVRAYWYLHDSPEAIVSDTPTPWKTEAAKEREVDILERLTLAWGLVWPWPKEIAEEVARIDYDLLNAEARMLGHADPSVWETPSREAQHTTAAELAGEYRAYRRLDIGCRVFHRMAANARPIAFGYDPAKDLTLLAEYQPIDATGRDIDPHSPAKWRLPERG